MKDIGKIIWPMAKVDSFTVMQMCMKVIGKMTKPMEEQHILMPMGLNIWEIGKMINKKVLEKKFGLMVLNMKANTYKERNKAKESFSGQMEVNMMDYSKIITFMVMVHILGLTEELIKVTGNIIKCMAKENLYGLMAENIMETMLKIRNMDLENLSGLMEENTKEIGKTASSMELELILMLKTRKKEDNGLMEKE